MLCVTIRGMTKAPTKFGRIYKRHYTKPDGTRGEVDKWTVRYKCIDYPTGSPDFRVAQRKLLAIAGDIARGRTPGKIKPPKPAPVPVAEPVVLMGAVLDGLEVNARMMGNRTAIQNIGRVDLHLRPFFDRIPVAQLTTSTFERFVGDRLAQDAKPATINKELSLVKRALTLAVKREPPLVLRFPHIQLMKVQNVRKGFFTHAQYLAMQQALPAHLVPVLVAGYHVGVRRGELLQIELRDVEMNASPQPQFRLQADMTKSGEGRVIPIFGEMIEVFRRQVEMTRSEYPDCRWLFHHEGKQIQTFQSVWIRAAKQAGCEGMLFHDLRRTAIRNLVRAGVSRKVAMAISGHKTEAVFERYDITDEADLSDAAKKLESYIGKLATRSE